MKLMGLKNGNVKKIGGEKFKIRQEN